MICDAEEPTVDTTWPPQSRMKFLLRHSEGADATREADACWVEGGRRYNRLGFLSPRGSQH